MASLTLDRVRDRVKLSATDIDDMKVTELIKDAEATIEEETGLSIDYANCSQAEAAAIKNLAALCCLVRMSAGAASSKANDGVPAPQKWPPLPFHGMPSVMDS